MISYKILEVNKHNGFIESIKYKIELKNKSIDIKSENFKRKIKVLNKGFDIYKIDEKIPFRIIETDCKCRLIRGLVLELQTVNNNNDKLKDNYNLFKENFYLTY
jgi:hypothetical protein